MDIYFTILDYVVGSLCPGWMLLLFRAVVNESRRSHGPAWETASTPVYDLPAHNTTAWQQPGFWAAVFTANFLAANLWCWLQCWRCGRRRYGGDAGVQLPANGTDEQRNGPRCGPGTGVYPGLGNSVRTHSQGTGVHPGPGTEQPNGHHGQPTPADEPRITNKPANQPHVPGEQKAPADDGCKIPGEWNLLAQFIAIGGDSAIQAAANQLETTDAAVRQ